jgi:type I restriction enzyme R subunit
VDDDHADLVVEVFKDALEDVYGEVRDGTVAKITGYVDEPEQLIRYYKNEEFPRIAVTVDLLTTGVDVPPITDLVFLRRVKSRILYEQMIGRATRLCPDLYGQNQDKETFRIFDAAQLYDALQDYSDMKPVVQQPNIPFSQLTGEFRGVSEEAHRDEVSDHPDEVRQTKRGYGTENSRPEAYLEGLQDWIESNQDELTALQVVLQRPRELTRDQLKELQIELSRAGYTETQIREAYSEVRNQEIAATVVGFLRRRALATPLLPYEERVDRALRHVLREHDWTSVQERWLERIAKQIKKNVVVDREALDEPPFDQNGGFDRLNTIFDGQLPTVLDEMHETIWDDDTVVA